MPAARKTRANLSMATLEAAAEVLRVLAHPVRMKLIELLLDGDFAVGELAEAVEQAPAAVSQHLNLMKARGIVEAERRDRQVYYRVVNENAIHMIECLRRYGDGR